ncbi:MAG: FAD-dependent oxidoreductase [Ramlibacter sp.]|nr:FAD-dependent oxidoreductase [Ramlibacter sp.]
MTKKVIVVGAGLAGLAAARLLHRQGLQVQVLEREARVGGRVFSRAFHGRTIECGAQFPSSGYVHMPALLAEAGLSGVPCSPWAAFERAGRWHRIHQNRPLGLWRSGLLRTGEYARLGWGAMAARRAATRFERAGYASYAPVDGEEAQAWCARALGPAAATHVFAPTIHGFYFHPLAGSSRALVQALFAFGDAQALAVPGGWDALARGLAQPLAVRTAAEVSSVRATPDGVAVQLSGERLNADAALIATPAPLARQLLSEPTPQEQALLGTNYAAAIHVALGFAPGWRLPDVLQGVHGFLLGPDCLVASMVVEQARLPCAAPEVLTLMLGDASARQLAGSPDDKVLQQVLSWLRARWPELPGAVVAHQVHRWALAEPLSPPGRARAVRHYRDTLPLARRILLCGDSAGLPWTDGAVDSGLWAAARLVERLS